MNFLGRRTWEYFVLLIYFFCLVPSSLADEVRMLSGEVVRGEVLEETPESIKVKIDGVDAALTFFRDEIQEVVRGKSIGAMEAVTHAVSPDVPSASAQGSWWKYSQLKDGEESQSFVRTTSLGTENVEVAGVMYKDALKERVVKDKTGPGTDHTLDECIVWSIPLVGMVRESCSIKKDEDEYGNPKLRFYTKELISANVNGMKYGE